MAAWRGGCWRSPYFLVGAACVVSLATGQDSSTLDIGPRTFDGTDNNVEFPAWGSVGSTQLRVPAEDGYEDDSFTPVETGLPTAREVMTDVILPSTPTLATKSALFVAWGQLLSYDLFLNVDNATEPFEIPCDDSVDIWCPLGAASDPIPFDRSDAAFSDGVRSPINYATAYIDLDYMYGRTEAEAEELRTMEGGMMNVTDSGVPFQNDDGTWMIPDQRTARFPVTFALHIMLLMEHNRCCAEVASDPDFDGEGDEDYYVACRAWTIASFQHVTENDYVIRLLGGSVTATLGLSTDEYSTSVSAASHSDSESHSHKRRQRRRKLSDTREQNQNDRAYFSNMDRSSSRGNKKAKGKFRDFSSGDEPEQQEDTAAASVELDGRSSSSSRSGSGPRRRVLYQTEDYDETLNAGADVFFTTAGGAALESAIPATVRIVGEGYVSNADDNIELTVAAEDIAGLFERNSVADILRGAVLSPALAVDTYYAAAVSNLSPLFKLPVDAVQRGRDHGLPTYNAARLAYDLEEVATFEDVTGETTVAALLSSAYGGDIDTLDAFVGALAEPSAASTGGVLGPLLHAAWINQLARTIMGDRFYHLHARPNEDVRLTALSDIIERTANATDLPLSVFEAPGVTVCADDCASVGEADVQLADGFGVAWTIVDSSTVAITLRARSIDDAGMLAIGWGGTTMASADDFVVCEVLSATEGVCTDSAPVSGRDTPPADDVGSDIADVVVEIDGEWTMVTFMRATAGDDDQDYDLASDIDAQVETEVIFSFREGPGVGQHPNANRGAASVNFATGAVTEVCNDTDDFVSLHGALMLIAWMLLAPIGIYYARYRKGDSIQWSGNEWFEMHEEIMILASEAVLPLGITAVFASGGDHTTEHAHWGYYMIAAVAAQLFTGFMRTKALEAKHSNFSFLHRCNKYFHIYAGRFAYVAGVVQCYRGLEYVSSQDELLFSAGDGLDLQLGNFGWVKDYMFPAWFALLALCFIVFETRKQTRRYFKKGAANICGCVELINEDYVADGKEKPRLMPRTEDLPIYTTAEFNDKVLNGQSWVLVDGAILDVVDFSHRHPGGARLILNAVGTDVTQELLGQELSVGHAMSFTPHAHPESAWEIVRSLVIGYIEEDDEDEEDEDGEEGGEALRDIAGAEKKEGEAGKDAPNQRFRMAAKKALLLPSTGRVSFGGDNLANKANRLNSIATIPDTTSTKGGFDTMSRGATTFGAAADVLKGPDGTTVRVLPKKTWSSRKLLERFHVCPLLFRDKMAVSSPVGRGDMPNKRPVYKYIFSCPGQAEALVQAITGVCYFNLRAAQEGGKGVVQRAYNAFAVRVQDTEPATPGGGVRGGGGTGAGTRKIVPAGETNEGMLCIEMRIRLYHDGAMSKLLEKLANGTDNPAVQLQGPFVIDRLVPPPAHRNVIMIAAGTGINPMVQQIRDYQQCARSRMSLLWQSTSESDLYCSEELTRYQAKSNGLLEVTAMISGEQRKRNIPGAAFRKAKQTLMAARHLVSPSSSSPNSSMIGQPPGRAPRQLPVDSAEDRAWAPSREADSARDGRKYGKRSSKQPTGSGGNLARVTEGQHLGPPLPAMLSHEMPRESMSPSRKVKVKRKGVLVETSIGSIGSNSMASNIDGAGGLVRGKVTRDILEKVFGESLLATLSAYRANSMAASGRRRGRNVAVEAKDAEDDEDDILDAICGTDTTAGKLQVVVSGPSGFVFYVETMLNDMGVPSRAVVLLD